MSLRLGVRASGGLPLLRRRLCNSSKDEVSGSTSTDDLGETGLHSLRRVRGFQDRLPSACVVHDRIISAAKAVAVQAGYRQV